MLEGDARQAGVIALSPEVATSQDDRLLKRVNMPMLVPSPYSSLVRENGVLVIKDTIDSVPYPPIYLPMDLMDTLSHLCSGVAAYAAADGDDVAEVPLRVVRCVQPGSKVLVTGMLGALLAAAEQPMACSSMYMEIAEPAGKVANASLGPTDFALSLPSLEREDGEVAIPCVPVLKRTKSKPVDELTYRRGRHTEVGDGT